MHRMRVHKSRKPKERTLVAADLLNPNHPLHLPLKRWVVSMNKGPELTKRKARKFLVAHKQFKSIKVAA